MPYNPYNGEYYDDGMADDAPAPNDAAPAPPSLTYTPAGYKNWAGVTQQILRGSDGKFYFQGQDGQYNAWGGSESDLSPTAEEAMNRPAGTPTDVPTGDPANVNAGGGPSDDVVDQPAPEGPPPIAPEPAPTGGPGGQLQTPGHFPVSSDWPTQTLPDVPQVAPYQPSAPFSYDPYAQGEAFQDEAYAGADPFSYDPYAGADPFHYDSFAAPSIADAENEPGYAFGKQEGMGALKNALSARGTANTGAAPKAFFKWADQYAQQNYGNVYNRAANTYGINRGNALETYGVNEQARAQTYDRNRGNAFDTWGANEQAKAETFDRNRNNKFQTWGGNELQRANAYTTNRGNAFENWRVNADVGKEAFDTNKNLAFDTYNAQVGNAQAAFAPKQRQAELSFDDAYRRFLAGLNANTSLAVAGANS